MQAAPGNPVHSPLEKTFVVLAVYLFSGAPLPLIRQMTDPVAAQAGDPWQQALWLIIYAVTGAILLPAFGRAGWLWRRNLALLALVMLAALSALWSVDPALTLRRAVTCGGTFLFATYLAARFTPAEIVRLIAAGLGTAAVTSVLMVVLRPDWGIMQGVHEGRWRGAHTHKNELGRCMALGFLTSLMACSGSAHWRRLAYGGAALLCLTLLALSQSATAWLATAITLLLWGFVELLRRTGNRHFGLALVAALAAAGFAAGLFAAFENQLLFSLLGRTSDLSQRLPIWHGALAAIMERPLLGYGYDVFWDKARGLAYAFVGPFLNWDAAHAHNGLLQLGLNLGLVGVALFLGNFISVTGRCLKLLRTAPAPPASFGLVIVTLTVLLNMAEVTIMRDNNIIWIMYLYVALRSSFSLHLLLRRPV